MHVGKKKQRDEEKNEQRMKLSQAENHKLEKITETASSSALNYSGSSTINSHFQCRGAEEDTDSCVAGLSIFRRCISPIMRTRSSKKIISPKLSGSMDRVNISDLAGVHILAGAARSLGHYPKQLELNSESFRRDRMRFPAEAAKEIKNSLSPLVALVVH